MKTTAFIIVFIFLSTAQIFSQSNSVMGRAVDSLSREPLLNANVILIHLPDSLFSGTSTNGIGEFKFSNVREGNYILSISFIGYKKFEQHFDMQNKSVDFETIHLTMGGVETDEVEVIGKLPPVTQKTDTVEFNADAFKINKDADAEGLISKMPGITVQDGKVQAQGEDVKRVLVDGREFFGDDPNAVLKNVPAEIIEKIQVFDEQSEQAQFTGFDDGNTNKTINIITRMRIREGTFGKFAAGFGNEEKYMAGGNINFFNDDQRITILSQINNINEQNFSSEDLLGVMSGSSNRGRGGSRGSRGRQGGNFNPGSSGGGNASDFLVNTRNGLSTTKSFGINYSNKWNETLELTSSYFFNLSDNDAESSVQREYFLSTSNQNYFEQNFSASKNINHRFNLRLEYQIDSSNSIIFRPRVSTQQSDGSSSLFGKTISDQNTLNSISNMFNSNLTALNSSAELLYRHRFETRGRTFSIGINSSYNKNDGDNMLLSENIFFDGMTSSDTLDQISDLLKDGTGGSANLVYTEPLGETGILQLNSRFSISEDESDQKTFSYFLQDNSYSSLDTLLSNVSQKFYNTQSYGVGYRFQENELSINVNLNYNLAELKSDQTFPRTFTIEKSFQSVLPSLMVRYNFSRDRNLRINYRTNNNDPSVGQLQNVLNNANPVQLSIGNPDLQQDYRHSFSLRYSEMNMENLHSFFVMLNSTFTSNYIGNNTYIASRDTTVYNGIILNRGTQIARPENLNGYINLRSFFTYSLPVSLIKSNVNLNLSANYTRTPGVINNLSGFSKSAGYGIGVVVSSNFSEDIDFTISTHMNFDDVVSTLRESANNNTYNQNSRLRFYWKFWEGFVIQTDLRHRYNSGLPEEYDQNSIQWNLNFGKKLFSNEGGEIRFSALDILNQDTNIRRETTDLYIEDTRSNVLGRYFTVSFIYNLRAF